MSTQGAVLFPNGQVGWFEMHTICPGWYSTVYKTCKEMRDHWHDTAPKVECTCGEKQWITLVQIADGYEYFPGVACQACLQFLGPCSMEGVEEVIWGFRKRGVPDWLRKECMKQAACSAEEMAEHLHGKQNSWMGITPCEEPKE